MSGAPGEAAVYDVEVITPGAPISFVRIESGEYVRHVIELALAAWGIPIPPLVQFARSVEFCGLLYETGEYHYADVRARVTVKRSA